MTVTTEDLTLHKRSGLLRREGTLDDYVIGERRQYLRLEPGSDDILLDVGANIGAVSALFLAQGVRGVIAVEPDPDNAEICRRNLAAWPDRGVVVEAAATATGAETDLYLNAGKNKGLHSTVSRRGREKIRVQSYTLEYLLEFYKPTLLKVDIEGGEYALASTLTGLPAHVRGVAIELHLMRAGWKTAAQLIAEKFPTQGFTAKREPKFGKNWTTMGIWTR